jgi:hypothetical protein
MSSELMGMKAITASIGYPLASLARKNDPKSYQNAEKALAVLLQVSTSLKSKRPYWSPERGFLY